ncbi:serine hydrolase [Patescibacteria group bacterium]|nr:serine hydrolase [Patescibacteria group bacterium]
MTLSRVQFNYLGSLIVVLIGIFVVYNLGPVPEVISVDQPPDILVPIVNPDQSVNIPEPAIQAPIAYAYALNSGTILFEKQADLPWSPASTTKLMTALVVKDAYTPNTLLTIESSDMILPEKPLFKLGEELTVATLLEAMLVTSSNQATYVLANHYPGGKEGFVKTMNQKAQDLGLTLTHFSDPAGFDYYDQKSTARDLVRLGQVVMADDDLRQMVSMQQTTISDFSGQNTHQLSTTNQLLGGEYQVVGIKTGTTQEAGQVLISQFRLPAEDVVVVVMGSQDRYSDTRLLVDWLVRQYHWFKMSELESIFIDVD